MFESKFRRSINYIKDYFNENIVPLSLGLIFFVFTAFVLSKHIFIIIPSGNLGVVYRPLFGGVDDKVILKEGLHIMFPWNTVFQYDARVQTKKIDIQVLTSDQLKTNVKISFQFAPNSLTLPLLHKYVGTNYLETVVIPEVVSITREIFGNIDSVNAFTTGTKNVVSSIALGADNQIINKLSPPGLDSVRLVTINAVQLESIEYPQDIQDAIQEKLKHEQISQSYVFKLESAKKEAERKEIEALGIQKFQNIVNSGLSDNYLKYRGIEATEKLSESANSKLIFIGGTQKSLPLLIN